MASTSVKVALRIRPLTTNEQIADCRECIACLPNSTQIIIGHDRSFEFDYVFDPDATQELVYQDSIKPMVNRFLDGYNVTVLAYGQTGSGKTHSMGTGMNVEEGQHGIVPRTINDVFKTMNELKSQQPDSEFEIRVSFLELYNEDLVDLLSSDRSRSDGKNGPQIREDGKGGIMWTNVEMVPAQSPEELFALLNKGSMCRTVGSTDMNLTSSRSHAIFSVTLMQRRLFELDDMGETRQPPVTAPPTPPDTASNNSVNETEKATDGGAATATAEEANKPAGDDDTSGPSAEVRTVISKFHFVDLAGSERLKRTNATGDRAKEGISINAGLLSLGNVISALADAADLKPGQPAPHVPYRDSKLTRLLQDSLGGNSQTLMMACVSSSDSNFSETLSTLRYATRARKIQNRARANVDEAAASAAEVTRLRAQVSRLQRQMADLRENGVVAAGPSPLEVERRKWLEQEVYRARFDAGKLKERIRDLEQEVTRTKAERDTLIFQYGEAAEGFDIESDDAVHPLILKYMREIADLEHQLKDTSRELRYYKEKDEAAEIEMESIDGFSMGTQSAVNSRPTSRAELKQLFEVDLDQVMRDADDNIFFPSDDGNMTDDAVSVDTRATTRASGFSSEDPLRFSDMSTTSVDDELDEDEDEDEYMEKMLRQINDSIVLKEGLLDHIEELQQAVATKETLVRDLERARYEQLMMREEYDHRLQILQNDLSHAQEERDRALKDISKKDNGLSPDAKQRYEQKMKALIHEISGLRKESSEANRSAETARSQNQFMVRNMKQHLETLKGEKQRMAKQMKEEAQRVREQISGFQREIQTLRRQERKLTDSLNRLEKQCSVQKTALKKEQDEKRQLQTQLKQAQKVLNGAKNNTSVRDSKAPLKRSSTSMSHRRSVPEPRKLNKRASTSNDMMDGTMSGIRTAFKRQLLEREISVCVAKRQVFQVLDELSGKRDRLQNERQALVEERTLILNEEEEATGMSPDPSTPLYMDERIELIEAEVDYMDARIRGLRVEAAQMNLWEPGPGWLGRDTAYDSAVQMLQDLPSSEARRMLWFFVDEVIRLRVDQWSRQMAVGEMEKSMMDMRRTLLMMRKTAVAAAVEYEKRLRQMEQRLVAKETGVRVPRHKEPKSPTSPAKDVAIFERIYERGIFTKAVRSVEGPASPLVEAGRRHLVTKSDGYLLAGQFHATYGGELGIHDQAATSTSEDYATASLSSGSSSYHGVNSNSNSNVAESVTSPTGIPIHRVHLRRSTSEPDKYTATANTLTALENGHIPGSRTGSLGSVGGGRARGLSNSSRRRSLYFQETTPSPTNSLASMEAQELCREVDKIIEASAANSSVRPRSWSLTSGTTVRSRTSLGSHSRSGSGNAPSLMSLITPSRKTFSSSASSTGADGSVVNMPIMDSCGPLVTSPMSTTSMGNTAADGMVAPPLRINTQLHRRDSISNSSWSVM
ncbi:hypothetical protein BDF19DRAFT_416176 [Syncephalis fuscata]|nr:hypothetical protein BDF19DRAFT_416176 [Syncephalis fuscata]